MSGSSDSEPLTSSDSFCNPQDVPMAAELRFANGSAARISEGLRSQSLLFDVSDLVKVLNSISRIFRDINGVTDNECLAAGRFIGDLLPATCFRLVQEDFLRCACPDLQQVQNALTKIIKLTGLLHLRVTEKTNGFEGLFEAALSNCLVSLMHLFDRDNFLHTTWFPSVMVEKISEAQQKWTPTVEELDSQMLAIENYIGVGGVKGCIQCLKSAGSFSMPLIESVISIVARISPTLVSCFPDECDDLCEALEAFQRYVLHCIEHDREKLADNSRDRSFSCLSRVLEALFTACCALLLSEVLADKQVRDIQRAFVLQLLSSSNFNKLLSAVKECHKMLERSTQLASTCQDDNQGESLKDNVCWMNTTGLIKQMLRANLHQRQYADLVFQILEVLTRFSFIQEEHLDMLWAATEQEGTFDEIKVNVYQIIEDLAARGLPPEQLDTLFYKFEIGRERSLPDTLRLLDLLKKLAASDSKAPHMAERLLDMIWQLTMPTHVDAPPELLQSNVMPDVLRQYLVHGNITFIRHYVHRCVEQLRTKQGIYPALHLLRNLLNLIEEREDKELEETIGQLDVEFQIQSFLVGSLREFKQLSKRRMTERLPLCVSSKQLRQPTVGAAPPLPSSASGIAQHSFSPTSTAATPVAQLSSTPAGTAASSAAQHSSMPTGTATGTAAAATVATAGGNAACTAGTAASPLASSLGSVSLLAAHAEAAVPPGTTVTTVTTTTDVSCLQRASAARPPGQGCYTYKQIVEEYMNVIQYIAMHHKNYFPRELALELWNLLVLEPLLPDDSAIGLSFFRNGVDPFSCTFMCPETQRELLCNHLTALNSGSLSKPAWDCFLSYFVTVNSEAKPPWLELSAQAELAQSVTAAIDAQQYTVHRMDVLGLRYLWDVALNCARHDVSNHAGLHLIRLHQSPALEGAMATFLSECTHHMTSAVEAISKLDLSSDSSTGWSQLIQVAWKMTQEPHAPCAALEHCQQRAQRSLDLLVKMLDITRGLTMPPVPSHYASCRGQLMVLDVQVQAPALSRFKIESHAHVYVGVLRRQIARRIGCDASKLRLLYAGDEWRNDTVTLGQAAAQKIGGRQVIIATVSLVDNNYTTQPAGYKVQWEAESPVSRLAHLPHIYDLLFFLADAPATVELQHEAVRVLKLLPTCPEIPNSLTAALKGSDSASTFSQIKALLFGMHQMPARGDTHSPGDQGVLPSRLLYTMQALHGIMFPSDVAGDVGALCESTQDAAGQLLGLASNETILLSAMTGCVPMLVEVVDQISACHGAATSKSMKLQDPSFLRELYFLLANMLANIMQAHAQARGRVRKSQGMSSGPEVSHAVEENLVASVDSIELSTGPGSSLPERGQTAPSTSIVANSDTASPIAEDVYENMYDVYAMEDSPPRRFAEQSIQSIVAKDSTSDAECLDGDTMDRKPSLDVVEQAIGSSLVKDRAGDADCLDDDAMDGRPSSSVAEHEKRSSVAKDSTSDADCLDEDTMDRKPSLDDDAMDGRPSPTAGEQGKRSSVVEDSAGDADCLDDHAMDGRPSPNVAEQGKQSSVVEDSAGDADCLDDHAMDGRPSPNVAELCKPSTVVKESAGDADWLDDSTLRAIVSLLIRLTWDVGRLWGLPWQSKFMFMDNELNPDVQLVKECTGTLQELLDSTPSMFSTLLTDGRSGLMVQVLLLHQHYSHIRSHTQETITRMCLQPSSQQAGEKDGSSPLGNGPYLWMLQLLVDIRADARAVAAYSSSYYEVFEKAIQALPDMGLKAAYTIAEQLLHTEVAALHLGDGLSPSSDIPSSDSDSSSFLEGRLRLILALLKELDHTVVPIALGCSASGFAGDTGGEEGEGLLHVLLTRYLFPEAMVIMNPDAGASDMEFALDHCCSLAGSRKAAYDLVMELMKASSATMEAGSTILEELHYKQGPITLARYESLDTLRSPGGYVGLRNGGATCYMNAVLQQLFMQPRIRELVLGAQMSGSEEEKRDSVFYQLQLLFGHLSIWRGGVYNPRLFWNSFKDYDGQPIDVKEHQDAYEFFTRLQDFVDQQLHSTGQTAAIHACMGGTFAQQIICQGIDYRSEREDEFYQISVDVKGKGSLEKSLESYVQGELMEGENAYYCEEVGRSVTALKRTCIKDLPQTLVVHLKRFEYDHMNMTRYKVRERFEFPVTLDMFRYTADGLAALEGSTAQVATAQQQENDVRVGGKTKSRNYYIYELKGIVVHNGTAFAGHYYSYIKERPKLDNNGQVSEGQWFLFDDKAVRPWDLGKVDADCFGGRCSSPSSSDSGQHPQPLERAYSAYMLFYERKDSTCFERAEVKMPCGSGQSLGAAALQGDLLQQQQCSMHSTSAANAGAGVPGAGVAGASAGMAGGAGAGGAGAGVAGAAGQVPMAGHPAHAEAVGPTQTCSDLSSVHLSSPSLSVEGRGANPHQTHGPASILSPAHAPQPHTASAHAAAAHAPQPHTALVPLSPYGMPEELFERILLNNLHLVHKLHVLNKDYFRFVKLVVERRLEEAQRFHHGEDGRGRRKVRRKDRGLLALSHGDGRAASPSSDGKGRVPESTSGDQLSCPSPSSQHLEEFEEAASQGIKLAVRFFLSCFVLAPQQLRTDIGSWRDLFSILLSVGVRPCCTLLQLLASPADLSQALCSSSPDANQLMSNLTRLAIERTFYHAKALVARRMPPAAAQVRGIRETDSDPSAPLIADLVFEMICRMDVSAGGRQLEGQENTVDSALILLAQAAAQIEDRNPNLCPGSIAPVLQFLVHVLSLECPPLMVGIISSPIPVIHAIRLCIYLSDRMEERDSMNYNADLLALFTFIHTLIVHVPDISEQLLGIQKDPHPQALPNQFVLRAEECRWQPTITSVVWQHLVAPSFIRCLFNNPFVTSQSVSQDLIKILSWESSTVSIAVLEGVRDLLKYSYDSQFACLMDCLPDLVLGMHDFLRDNRIYTLYNGLPSHNIPGMQSLLTASYPNLRALAWYMVTLLANASEGNRSKLRDWICNNRASTIEVHQSFAVLIDAPDVDEDCKTRATQVVTLIAELFPSQQQQAGQQ